MIGILTWLGYQHGWYNLTVFNRSLYFFLIVIYYSFVDENQRTDLELRDYGCIL